MQDCDAAPSASVSGPAMSDMGWPPDEPAREGGSAGAGPVGRPPDLETALDRLPEPQRRVLLWRHRDHLPFEEIARRLDLPLAGAQTLWFRALEALSQALELTDGPPGSDAE